VQSRIHPASAPGANGTRPRSSTAGRRVVIEHVTPEIDSGRFPAKRCVGETVVVEADVFADGHDHVAAVLRHRTASQASWCETPMRPVVNDRWRGEFSVESMERHVFTVAGWVDRFATWHADLLKRVDAGQDVAVELLVGAELVEAGARRAKAAGSAEAATLLRHAATNLRGGGPEALATAGGPTLAEAMWRYPDRRTITSLGCELVVEVDRERAGFAAWYELFPRSTAVTTPSSAPGPPGDAGVDIRHGTFDDVARRLPAIAEMGFDVVYLPPIHPIGTAYRKGRNNAETPEPDAPGSPWAIGSAEGGHDAIHPELGTLEDFDALVRRADELDLEIALDLALQASPDHPWVREHSEWFAHRPDGSIRYAENPPKRYQDIYPLDFSTPAWPSLWEEILRVTRFWVGHGIRTFRVDNPHTKPFAFWEWLIAEVRRDHPETVFLAEAFTRPKVMRRLAKVGFTQSYTYFAWRAAKWELTEYLTELTQTEMVEYYRPSLWPNTPDILTAYLAEGGRPAFVARLVLAATLGALYGIYGPAFELMERTPREPGSEEYLHSEKYEIRSWDTGRADSLAPLLTQLNAVRHANPALHGIRSLRFSGTDNEQIICYHKRTDDWSNVILVLVNLDPGSRQSCFTDLWLEELGLVEGEQFVVRDLLTGATFPWRGRRNFVALDRDLPAHVLEVQRLSGARDGAGTSGPGAGPTP
jgi:starch synthase (maltosyl-transferring)